MNRNSKSSRDQKNPEQTPELAALARTYRQHLTDAKRLQEKRGPRIEPLHPSPYYVCQVCYQDVAQWPKPRHHDFKIPFTGRIKRILYVTPMVCTQCRFMRQPEVTALGDGRRRFWKRVISWYLNEPYPSMGHGMARLFIYRQYFQMLGAAAQKIREPQMTWAHRRLVLWVVWKTLRALEAMALRDAVGLVTGRGHG